MHDYLYVSEINIDSTNYIEMLNDKIYFIKNNKLYSFTKLDMVKFNSKINFTLVPTPAGIVLSMIKFQESLILSILDDSNANQLFLFNNNKFQLLFDEFHGITKQYFITNDNRFCIFFEYGSRDDSFTRFYICDNKFSIKQYVANITCDHFHNLIIHQEELYFAIGDKPHRIIKTNFSNLLNNDKNDINFEIVKETSAYSFLVNDENNSLLLADDGLTRITDLNGVMFFQDIEKHQSGFQIASTATFNLNNKYKILGTWRRSQEHPFACFYVLGHNQTQIKLIDKLHVDNAKSWTGYTRYDNSLMIYNSQNEIIIANEFSNPLYIKGFNSYDSLTSEININHTEIKYTDKTFSLLYKKIDDKIIQSDVVSDKNHYFTNKKNSNVYITIDVEQNTKTKPFCLTGEGLTKNCSTYFIMDTLEKYSLKGIFFINVYEPEINKNIVKKLIKDIYVRGHEVALHCHVNNIEPPDKHNISEYSSLEQKNILQYGKHFIEEITGESVYSYRGGAYDISESVLSVLEEIGFKVDSSCAMISLKNLKYQTKNKVSSYSNIVEVPVTSYLVKNQLTKIDINWNGTSESMINAIKSCRNNGLQDIVVMAHSFSFIKFTKEVNEYNKDLFFTSKRYANGVNEILMKEFDKFCQRISILKGVEIKTFKSAYDNGDYLPQNAFGKDVLPSKMLINEQYSQICPICNTKVLFLPYRERENAICPKCSSLERMRLKFLFLKQNYNIRNVSNCKILHFGPALCIMNYLKSLQNIDYISSDPYNKADFKFKLENIPFMENTFDCVIAIHVMMHLLDDRKAFNEIYRVLKKEGVLLVTLGNCREEKTKEFYDRNNFSKMVAHDFSSPESLVPDTPKEIDGKIYYNPRHATRIYGKDILSYLESIGFALEILRGDGFENFENYGIPANEFLIVCTKQESKEKTSEIKKTIQISSSQALKNIALQPFLKKRAFALCNTNQLLEAENLAKSIIANNPYMAWAYYILGRVQRKRGEFDLALENYQKAINLESTTEYFVKEYDSALRERAKT